jgi:mannitol-1-phosphate/altronate dehydrogenase
MTVPSTISAPRYDAAAVVPSVVHLGLGAFHRAHQAVYADDVLATGSLSGGICAVSLRNSTLPAALSRQGFRYHVVETDDAGDRVRAISSIRQALSAGSHGMAAVIDRLADPRIEVVTITVTEKGYCAVGATGALDLDRDEVAHDLLHPAQPQSMPGVLVEALARRRVAGVAPFSVCSCDNIRSNGATTRRVVTQLDAHRGDDLADCLALVVAAYAICLLGPPARRLAIADPTLHRLIGPALKSTAPAAEAVDRLLSLEEIFGRDLASAPQFRTAVHRHAELLWRGELSLALARTGKGPL